jgi:hypothetical protein|tara:strand:+ start:1414 stop:1677 length:264 start_codon:yes stop_codon:yes gene_type:complete
MAAKGQAAKSASGASMSKYDVEVEGRLQKLEETIVELKKEVDSHKHPVTKSGEDGGRIDSLIEKLNSCEILTQYFPKGADGVRRIDI